MADDFRNELIGISEKLASYNSAMQESLNILSDEFLLLRDELSTLNQNLEKTKALDEKLDSFNKTVETLEKMKGSFATLEKVSESFQAASALSQRIEALTKSADNKERLGEAISPLSKKMDLLFSKFDEGISPLGKKVDGLSDSIREEGRALGEAKKEGESLKSLVASIQDELAKFEKSFTEQTNAVRSVGTSIAYLSETEADMKKSLEVLAKTYEQDREKAATEKAQTEANGKKKDLEATNKKLGEIEAILKVQIEQLQKQEILLDGMKKGARQKEEKVEMDPALPKLSDKLSQIEAQLQEQSAKIGELKGSLPNGNLEEAIRHSGILKKLEEQSSKLEEIKGSIPTGNFEEVIKHADLINQSTNSKLDSISELGMGSAKAAQGYNERMAQLPQLMQNISSALDMLVQEMKKSQTEFRGLQSAVQIASLKSETPPEHFEKLEAISDNLRGLHTKIDSQQAQPAAGMQYEEKLNAVIDELHKFEELQQQRMQKPLDETSGQTGDMIAGVKFDLLAKQLNKIEELLSQSQKRPEMVGAAPLPPVGSADVINTKIDSINEQLRKLSEVLSKQGPSTSGSPLPASTDLLTPKIDALNEQISKLGEFMRQQPGRGDAPAGAQPSLADAANTKLEAQLISLKNELIAVSQNVKMLKDSFSQGIDVSTEVDLTPVLRKMDELESKIGQGAAHSQESAPNFSAPSSIPTERLIDQRQILEEIQQNVHIFETFELSDRAKIVVDRLSMLVKRAIAAYSV